MRLRQTTILSFAFSVFFLVFAFCKPAPCLDDDIFIKFWGVRDEIPVSAEWTSKFGGNSPCIELRIAGKLNIIDAGTGIYQLGESLTDEDEANIFLTHTHYDRLIGFPVFQLLDWSSAKINVIGPVNFNQRLKDIVSQLMSYSYYPTKLDWKQAQLNFIELKEGTYDFPPFTVKTINLNHPISTLGYRFEYQGKTVVIMSDTEPYSNVFGDDNAADAVTEEMNQKIISFAKDADVLIMDAMYTDEEYASFAGNGHSPLKYALSIASKSNPKTMILYPHAKARRDEGLEEIEEYCENKLNELNTDTKCIVAHEGLELNL